jgi:hypothetical protein
MKKKTARKAEAAEVPEVIEFIDAQSALSEFKNEHAAVFEQLEQLTDRYNTALESAEKACRSLEVSCGPFDLYQFRTTYNPERLFNAVGRDKFLELGGKLDTKTVYDIDKGRFDVCVSQNKVAQDIVAEVRVEAPSFHKPNKLVVP